jgi:hypothetical protein
MFLDLVVVAQQQPPCSLDDPARLLVLACSIRLVDSHAIDDLSSVTGHDIHEVVDDIRLRSFVSDLF